MNKLYYKSNRYVIEYTIKKDGIHAVRNRGVLSMQLQYLYETTGLTGVVLSVVWYILILAAGWKMYEKANEPGCLFRLFCIHHPVQTADRQQKKETIRNE